MSRAELKWHLPEDRMSVTLEMHIDGEPKAHFITDAANFEQIIADFAKVRAQMTEEVTPDLEVGMRLEAVVDPRWRTEPYYTLKGVMLALRHPGHGWVSFLLPPAEALALGKSLMGLSEQLPAQPKAEDS